MTSAFMVSSCAGDPVSPIGTWRGQTHHECGDHKYNVEISVAQNRATVKIQKPGEYQDWLITPPDKVYFPGEGMVAFTVSHGVGLSGRAIKPILSIDHLLKGELQVAGSPCDLSFTLHRVE